MISAIVATTSQLNIQRNIVLDAKASKVRGVLISGTRSSLDNYVMRVNAF